MATKRYDTMQRRNPLRYIIVTVDGKQRIERKLLTRRYFHTKHAATLMADGLNRIARAERSK